jgi:hypothetical protein
MSARPEVEELFSIEGETGELPSVSRLIRAPSVAKRQQRPSTETPLTDLPAIGQSKEFSLQVSKLKDATLLDFGVTDQLILKKNESVFATQEFFTSTSPEPWRAAAAKGFLFDFNQFSEVSKEFASHQFVELSLNTRPNFQCVTQFIRAEWMMLVQNPSNQDEIHFLFSKKPLSPMIIEIKERISPSKDIENYGKIELAD